LDFYWCLSQNPRDVYAVAPGIFLNSSANVKFKLRVESLALKTQFQRKTIINMKLSIATILSLAAGASAFTAPSLPTAVRSTTQVSETKVCFRTVFQYDLLKNSFDRGARWIYFETFFSA